MRKIALILAVLIILLAALSVYYRSTLKNEDSLTIVNGNEFTEISFNDIRKIGSENLETKVGKNFIGFSLKNIFLNHNLELPDKSKITFHSEDGGRITFAETENFYLVFQSASQTEYLRLIIPEDEFAQRWLKYIVKIELK